jgi:hypothetical protein
VNGECFLGERLENEGGVRVCERELVPMCEKRKLVPMCERRVSSYV